MMPSKKDMAVTFSYSVCPLGVLCCVCGVLGNLAPVQR